jgi:hypothetical protein
MGLDMYAFSTTESLPASVDFKQPDAVTELHYWRKHPNLHGWMQELYGQKGGEDSGFNLRRVQLTKDDLNALKAAIKGKILPGTEGFFFGASDGSENEDDLLFVSNALAAIGDGKSVYYVAWW